MSNNDELPEVCKGCPENECCNHKPDMWKCDEPLPVKIQAGDTVYHKPCDEKWYVLGVNYTTGRLCVAGWPHTIADIADCTLVEKGTGITEEEAAARQRMFGGGWE